MHVDFSKTVGAIRPINGGNNGPIMFGGLVDLSADFRELAMPGIRLHDCGWPADMVVDVHCIFPNFEADDQAPASYDFVLTDQYLKSIANLPAAIQYRLGCRIEHTPHRRHAHPPRDFAKWARICTRIVAHYEEGWGGGDPSPVRWWEIWNEPDIPPGCWSGTWDDYYRLYVATAREIKAAFPHVLVGGPAYAYANDDHAFVEGLLKTCREEGAPMDFFSWHTYAGRDLSIWERRARTMRDLLDANGFANVPSHLNEWNCCPDGDWTDWPTFSRGLCGPRGASGVAASLCYFQDLPIDEAFLYSVDNQIYGIFGRAGERQKNWQAMRAYRMMLETPVRAQASGSDGAAGLAILAGMANDATECRVLLSRYVTEADMPAEARVAGLPWEGPTTVTRLVLDETHDLEEVGTTTSGAGPITLPTPPTPATLYLYRLRPA